MFCEQKRRNEGVFPGVLRRIMKEDCSCVNIIELGEVFTRVTGGSTYGFSKPSEAVTFDPR